MAVASRIRRPIRPAALKPGTTLKYSDRTIRGLTGVFKLLADESRLKILLALSQDGELHVTALCDLLGQSQPAVSHHLTLLRMANLVHYRRSGKNNLYSVDTARVCELLGALCHDAGNGSRQFRINDFTLAYRGR